MSDTLSFQRHQSELIGPPEPPPARNGQSYTDDDHETMVTMAREGAPVEAIARKLQRQPAALLVRMRKLLPPAQRHCPTDRVLPALQAAADRPDYDWRVVVLESPPPPPVQKVIRAGIEGLDTDQLLLITHAVGVLREPGTEELVQELATAVRERGLTRSLIEQHLSLLRRTDRGSLANDRDVADAWVADLTGDRIQHPDRWSWQYADWAEPDDPYR
ncbi:hypothetical protein [Enemella evansiae]|uniref:Uncharacterized protein n=1 Tax=Enemella evansiae TaxID=2016499 RepID=A0A255GFV8_9ACTN|nr:hypothetical protein [Enemella evansiae]PFG67939.1 hypothetical protein B0O41_2763 [Propionibacteriaceae bacterium ES.041]OYN93103.1 hypothetical protein CGZ95_20880 [Enemella evansiae]OYN95852.1 hypothetical protein CGZ96_15300 [Enemella evansiae]OYO04061.1 hypothetical protein CGZ97_11830 [Enemella evansiae]OYO14727.1 hypothetical protein CGZ94_09190 [Enemella evansiae]